jgi:drug/metabolite transporter (DMT)-like permease
MKHPTSALFALCVAIWGSTWLAITFQLGEVAPEASVCYRFALSSALLFAWCVLRGQSVRFSVRQHGALVLQGVLMFGVSYLFVYRAESLIVSGLVAVGFSLSPLVNMLLARLAFDVPMSARVALGSLLGIAGIVVLFAPEFGALGADRRTLEGAWYVVLAVVTSAAGSVIASRNGRIGLPVWPALAWGMLYGSACSLLAVLASGKQLAFSSTPGYIASLLYLSVLGSVVAFSAYMVLLQRIGAARTGYLGVAVPVIALVLSTLFEGYVWRSETWIGVGLAVIGNIVVLRRQ